MEASKRFAVLGDRLNPILVKEVRQALRGRGFRILLSISLLVAAGLYALVLIQTDAAGSAGDAGRALLTVLLGCQFLTLVGLVPLFAFQTYAQEWDEGTLDLLLLSQLTPGRIAFGKWLTIMLLAMLITVAFAPYLAMALLLEGTDPLVALVLLGSGLVLCGAFSAFGMALAGTLRGRGPRSAGQGILALAGLSTASTLIPIARMVLGAPQLVRDGEFWREAWAFLMVVAFAGGMFLLGARAHLAHPEEGPSMRARVALAVGAFAVPLLAALPSVVVGGAPYWEYMWPFFGLLLFGSLFLLMGERPAMGRVVASRMRGRGVLSVLAHPFLPGAGRTPALFLVTFGALAAAFGILRLFGAYPDIFPLLSALGLYAWIYLVPALLLGSFAKDLHGRRWALRLVAGAVGPLWFAGGVLLGRAFGDTDMMNGRHLGNPIYGIGRILNGWMDGNTTMFWWLVAVAGVGLLAVLPKIVAAIREERRARRTSAPVGEARSVSS